MVNLINEIILGEDARSVPRRGSVAGVAVKEEGMISLITLLAVLFFLILIGLVGNAGRIVSEKIEVQNGADAVAYSSGIVMARTLNAVTATNHLIGELNALAVLQHAFNGGGEDRPPSGRMRNVEKMLDLSFKVAKNLGNGGTLPTHPNQRLFLGKGANDLNDEIPSDAGATLAWSMHRLQLLLTWTYQTYSVGALLQKAKPVPIIGQIAWAIGVAIATAAIAVETKIGQERFVLDRLKDFSDSTDGIKEQILESTIPEVYKYETQIHEAVPDALSKALKDVRTGNRLDEVQMYPPPERGAMEPPLMMEPGDFGAQGKSSNELYRSQLVRATYPWVSHWRHPLFQPMSIALLLARTGLYYEHYTDRYTREKSFELKQKHRVQLLVLKDTNLATKPKGEERWNRDSRLADQRFAFVGFAQRATRDTISPKMFPPENSDGIVCYSQILVYNANPQKPGSGSRYMQAKLGWDTLNWKSAAPEMPDTKKDANEFQYWKVPGKPPQPEIRLNWQTKLVPVTRLQEAKWSLSGSIRKAMNRVNPQYRALQTH